MTTRRAVVRREATRPSARAHTIEVGDGRRFTRLASGIEVLTDPSASAETLSINVAFRVGSCDEGTAPHGSAHFLEHMAFRGTARRTGAQIRGEIADAGGALNASTDWDTTTYDCTTLRDELAPALDILADMVTQPTLDPADVELERNVIKREIDERNGTWATMQDCLFTSAYGEQDVARPIIGTEDGLRAITAETLRAFLTKHYTTGNLIVAVAGNIAHEQVVALIEEKFARLPKGRRTPMPTFDYIGGEQGFACSCERGIVRIGYEAPIEGDPSYAASVMFRNIVGYGSSSRLFKELREKRGLVYSVDSRPIYHCGAGLALFETEGEAAKIKDIFLHMHDTLQEAAAGITEAEVAQARRLIRAWDRMGRDNMCGRTTDAIFNLVAYGRVLPLSDSDARFAAVSAADVRAAGRRMLASPPTLVAHGHARAMPRLALLKGRGKPSRTPAGKVAKPSQRRAKIA